MMPSQIQSVRQTLGIQGREASLTFSQMELNYDAGVKSHSYARKGMRGRNKRTKTQPGT